MMFEVSLTWCTDQPIVPRVSITWCLLQEKGIKLCKDGNVWCYDVCYGEEVIVFF